MCKKDNADFTFSLDKDPYNFAMKVFCKRWKPFILQAINTDTSTRYSTFRKRLPISEKVLANNLRELEQDGLIIRNVYYEVPLRVEYTLTEVGMSVCKILDIIYCWGREEMMRRNMEIDLVGEMYHGYTEKDNDVIPE